MAESDKLALIANVAASYLRRNSVGVDQIGNVFSSVVRAVEQAAKEIESGVPAAEAATPTAEAKRAPAVSVRKSVQHDYIVCLEDGLRARTLKRHLQAAHGMTPQQYREKWNLPKDYPLVAPAYSESRSKMAKALGLGRIAGSQKGRRGRKARTPAS
jgi:predicted transcriptional regulator